MDKYFRMNAGDGPNSYSKNSNSQRMAANRIAPIVEELIINNLDMNHHHHDSSKPIFTIADLGCATGSNTFAAVQNIIETVTRKFERSQPPQFQVFFNDLVSNDFNTLFANLPSDRKYLAAAVPGSFYGRLFANDSIDYVYSSSSLHWLSMAPQASNRGRIFYDANAPKEVVEAYSDRYSKDFESFLGARSEEMVAGGLMTLLIYGRPEGTTPWQSSFGPVFHPLELSMLDMVNEGKLSEDLVDSFNIPIYSPSTDELRGLVEKNGSFEIVKMDANIFNPGHPSPFPTTEQCKAVVESLLVGHFGAEITEQVLERFTEKTAEHPPLRIGDGITSVLLLALQRKSRTCF